MKHYLILLFSFAVLSVQAQQDPKVVKLYKDSARLMDSLSRPYKAAADTFRYLKNRESWYKLQSIYAFSEMNAMDTSKAIMRKLLKKSKP